MKMCFDTFWVRIKNRQSRSLNVTGDNYYVEKSSKAWVKGIIPFVNLTKKIRMVAEIQQPVLCSQTRPVGWISGSDTDILNQRFLSVITSSLTQFKSLRRPLSSTNERCERCKYLITTFL